MRFRIPKQQKPTRERIDVRLEQTILEKLDRYCRYLESDRDYVVSTVLQIVFKKDKGFAEWLRTHNTSSDGEPAARRAGR